MLILLILALCASTSFGEIYKIKPFKRNIIDSVTHAKYHLDLEMLSHDHVKAASMTRTRRKNYCFSGGPLDKNTGCNEELSVILPHAQESYHWVRENSCFTGEDVFDKWGSDSEVCFREQTMNLQWANGKSLSSKIYNNHFWYHTCTISWSCFLTTTEFPVFIGYNSKNLVTPYIDLSNGTRVWLSTENPTFFSTFDTAYLVDAVQVEIKSKVLVQCLHAEGVEECQVTDYPELVFNTEEKNVCYDKYCIKDHKLHKIDRIHEAAEVTTVEHLRQELNLERLNNRINSVLNEKRIYQTGLILIKLIEYLEKQDQYILGYVLGKPLHSRSIGSSLFELWKDPNKMSGFEVSNFDTIGKGSNSLYRNKALNITEKYLFETDQLSIFKLDHTKIKSLSSSTVKIVEIMDSMEALQELIKKRDVIGSSLSDLLDMPKGYLNSMLHTVYLMVILGIVATLVLMVIVVKVRKVIFGSFC
uniref:Putative glycoprotein n=1 Tax=Soybean thrips thogotovirus 2 TaxID=2796554 RepID=A0A7T3UYP9_9ORTO|nr:putative glycoprotein [Soybean thrips thogotovirus 2]